MIFKFLCINLRQRESAGTCTCRGEGSWRKEWKGKERNKQTLG